MAITVGSTAPTSGLLTSMGVGSGLDVATLVAKLVAAKKAPQQDQITNASNSANIQLSALGQINAALSALQSAMAPLTDGSAFGARAVSSSDPTVFGASSSGNPVSGSYNVVVDHLASSLKASSAAFVDSNAPVGTGTLTITVAGQPMKLELDAGNNSLAQIRDAINKASDNPGVSATIVNGTDGAHLVLSGTRTGAANGFSVTSSGGDGNLAALHYDVNASSGNALSVVTAAQDSAYTIDGLAGTSVDNTVSGAIDGLTLNLVAAGNSKLTVSSDSSKGSVALTNLVNTYNSFIGIYQNLTKYDSTSGAAGALIGDATLNSINSTLSRIVGGTANGSTLSSIGISLQVDGTLKLDSDKAASALSDGGKQVDNLFGGTEGFAAKLNTSLNNWVGATGVLAGRTTSLAQQLRQLTVQQTTLNGRMDALTARYQAQFTALDTLMSKLSSTSTYLQQQFDAMNNYGKK